MRIIAPNSYLPDTSILVHAGRRSPLYQSLTARYPLSSNDPSPVLSVISVGEIRSFAEQNTWGMVKRQSAEDFVARCIVLPLEYPGIIEAYVIIDNYNRVAGRTMGDNDTWIAATAKATGATLITTDKDFDHLSPALIRRDWINPATP